MGKVCDECQANSPKLTCDGSCPKSAPCSQRFECIGCLQMKCNSVFHARTPYCKSCAYITCSRCQRKVLIITASTGACWNCEDPFPEFSASRLQKKKLKKVAKRTRQAPKRTKKKLGSTFVQGIRYSHRLIKKK